MRKGRIRHGCLLMLSAGLLALLMPGWAQTSLPREMVLNNVTLNSTYNEVLSRLGMPHFIGPSVTGLADVTKLLMPDTPATGQPNMDGELPSPEGAAPAEKTLGPFLIWRYDGSKSKPSAKADYTTYVFFNDTGVVQAVVVILNNHNVTPSIRTESEIQFGTKLMDIVKKYDWPTPFAPVGGYYFCYYPEQNVTFGLDASTRRVVCIGIGIPVTVTAQTSFESAQVSIVTPAAPASAPATAPTGSPVIPLPAMGGTLPKPPPPPSGSGFSTSRFLVPSLGGGPRRGTP